MAMEDQVAEILSRPYARVLEREPDGRYSARVLEFPGAFADGDSADVAIASLDEILRSFVAIMIEDDRAIPKPLAAAEYAGRISLRIPPSLHAECARLAAATGVSLNRFLSDAIARYVGSMTAT